jgi:hypothetical protein
MKRTSLAADLARVPAYGAVTATFAVVATVTASYFPGARLVALLFTLLALLVALGAAVMTRRQPAGFVFSLITLLVAAGCLVSLALTAAPGESAVTLPVREAGRATTQPDADDGRATDAGPQAPEPPQASAPEQSAPAAREGEHRRLGLARPSEAVARLNRASARLAAEAGALRPEAAWDRARSLRVEADRHAGRAGLDKVHRRLDQVITAGADEAFRADYEAAAEVFEAGEYAEAATRAGDLLARIDDAAVPALRAAGDGRVPLAHQAVRLREEARTRIAQRDDPAVRFRVLGLVSRGGEPAARLLDQLTGRRHLAVAGDRIEAFRIVEVDLDRETVRIRYPEGEKEVGK